MKPENTTDIYHLKYEGLNVMVQFSLDIPINDGYYIEQVSICNKYWKPVFKASEEQCAEIQRDDYIQKQLRDCLKIDGGKQ